MAEALADRLAHIEELLGINASDSKLPNLDISSLRKKLQNLKNQDGIKTDFIMKIPRDKLQRLNKGIRQPDLITMKEKLIAIDFARELMLKRSELLEELKRLSEVAFKSDDFSKIPEFESTLARAEKELSEALADAVKYDDEIHEFYNEYLPMLSDLQSRVEEIEQKTTRDRSK